MKVFLVTLAAIAASFYFFPFEFVFLPVVNTKMMVAVAGCAFAGIDFVKNRRIIPDRRFVEIFFYALAVSFISLVSITYNGTHDHSFTGYFVSMLVWIAGAWGACGVIKAVHGRLDAELVAAYLVLICSAQCILAFIMNMYEPLRLYVDGFLGGAEEYMGIAEGRLYGIGCALDVAGLKFSAVLVIIAFLSVHGSRFVQDHISWYVAAFIVMTVIGNMISRTTLVGVLIAVFYWTVSGIAWILGRRGMEWGFVRRLAILLAVAVPVVVISYNLSPVIASDIRFAFEGFFSLFETGHWYTHSSDILINHMIVFPDNARTWIIGDGLAANPVTFPEIDPYYTGEEYHGYYMATDIGYLRYIFYFGLTGLILFITYFCKVAQACMRFFPRYRVMFLMILAVNFIGWLKVSTDIFPVFAAFLAVALISGQDKYEDGDNGSEELKESSAA